MNTLRILLASLALTAFCPAPLLAQDECASAVPVVEDDPIPFTTAGATPSAITWGETCVQTNRDDVWFRFDVPADGVYVAQTCGGTSSALELFAGPCGSLERIDCDRGRCRHENAVSRGGKVYFRATQGERIHARVGTSGTFGVATGDFWITGATPLPNDDISTPALIAVGDSLPIDLFPATLAGPAPVCGPQYGGDLWYQFTPTETAAYEASTCSIVGANLGATSISLYDLHGGVPTLRECSAGNCSQVMGTAHRFEAFAGQPVLLRVLGHHYLAQGELSLDRVGDLECWSPAPIQMGNTDPFFLSQLTFGAGPFVCGGNPARDTWRRFVPTHDGTYAIACRSPNMPSSSRLMLEVFRGPCDARSLLGCKVSPGANDAIEVAFEASAGEEILVRMGTDEDWSVTVQSWVTEGPENDLCTNATPVPLNTWLDFQTGTASRSNFGFNCSPGDFDDIWFRVDAVATGSLTVYFEDSLYGLAEVYVGDCWFPVLHACSPPGTTPFERRITFDAVAGRSYWIRVQTPPNSVDGRILVDAGVEPPYDMCSHAAPLTFGENIVDLLFSTPSVVPGGACEDPSLGDVWFTFTAARDAIVGLFTCESNARALQLFEGSDCAALTQIDCATDAATTFCYESMGQSRFGQSIYADVEEGQTYYLLVRGDHGPPSTLIAREWVPDSVGTPFCSAVVNSTGNEGHISAFGSAVILGEDLTFRVEGLPFGSVTMFLVSAHQGFVMNPGGSLGDLCLGGEIGRFNRPGDLQIAGSTGIVELPLEVSYIGFFPLDGSSLRPDQTWHFQAWYRDTVGGALTSNFTDGLRVTFE
ncbi:MAG: hypothetical protein AAFU73_09585 [Planctomycetota bacterium]